MTNTAPREHLASLRSNIQKVLMGKQSAVDRVLMALLARGHVLLEDVPGVGKTILTRALAGSLGCAFSRIQLTPDLLPSDILGVSVYNSDTGEFVFKRGPIFANIVLADEINRTTPRTQSALLEAMNESQVTADGQALPLGPPFMVMATQNPYDFEGTYFLPENQLDRFMIRIRLGYPDKDTEREILRVQPAGKPLSSLEPVMNVDELLAAQEAVEGVTIDDAIIDYILEIAEVTRRSEELTVGISPRGTQALMRISRASAMLAGRDYVVPDDVKSLATAVCAHRLLTRAFAQDGSAAAADAVFERLLETVPVPQ